MSRIPDMRQQQPAAVPDFTWGFDLGGFWPTGDQRGSLKPTIGFGTNAVAWLSPSLGLEATFTSAIGAAGIGQTIQTDGGTRKTIDYEAFLMFGVRSAWRSADRTATAAIGSGVALASYEEVAGNPWNETITCYSCMTPTRGKGYYVVADLEGLSADGGESIGLVARIMSVKMKDWLFPENATSRESPRDAWVSVALKFALHF